MEVGAKAMAWPLYPRERAPVPILQEVWWAPGAVWTGVEKRKCLALPRFEPGTVKPVAFRCKEYTFEHHIYCVVEVKLYDWGSLWRSETKTDGMKSCSLGHGMGWKTIHRWFEIALWKRIKQYTTRTRSVFYRASTGFMCSNFTWQDIHMCPVFSCVSVSLCRYRP
jgi:hypothetical protein